MLGVHNAGRCCKEAQPAEPQSYPALLKTCRTRKWRYLPTTTDIVIRPTTFVHHAKTRPYAESRSGIVHVRHNPGSTTPQSPSAACTTDVFSRSSTVIPAMSARIEHRSVGRDNVAWLGARKGLGKNIGEAPAGRESRVCAGVKDDRRANPAFPRKRLRRSAQGQLIL